MPHLVQGKFHLKPSIWSITSFHLFCQPILILFTILHHFPMSVSWRWWGIHQGPPSISLFMSTSTHHLRIWLRNQLVPCDLHAWMEGLLASDSRFRSLTSDQMIPRMFDFNSFIHICWNVLGYLGIHWHHWWFPSHLLTIYLNDQ